MPLGRHADCGLGHIHAMRCACLASALQHGLNAPYVHALAAAGVQERHLSRHDVVMCRMLGEVLTSHMAVWSSPTLCAVQSARAL